MEDPPDPVDAALLRRDAAFPLGHPERRSFVAAGGLDLQQAFFAVGLERLHIVAIAIAVEVGHPPDILGQVVPAGPLQPATLEPHHELLAGLAEGPVALIPGSRVELPDQAPDARRAALRIAVEERRRRHQDVVLSGDIDGARLRQVQELRMLNYVLPYGVRQRVLIVVPRLVALDPWQSDLVENRRHVLVLEFDRSLRSTDQFHDAKKVRLLAVGAPRKLVSQHHEIAAQQHDDLVGRPVGASLARVDADFSHLVRSLCPKESYQVGAEAQ